MTRDIFSKIQKQKEPRERGRRHERGREPLSSFTREIVSVNPGDKDFARHRYLLWFSVGGYARAENLLVWANNLEEASEIAVDWIVENRPGILSDDYVKEEYDRAIAQGKSEEEAMEEAEMDQTMWGHSGMHWVPSENWGITYEDPTREQLLEFEGRPPERRVPGKDPLASRKRGAFSKRSR